MADDAAKAGGISFELRAEFENLATGLAQTQQMMEKFSGQMQTVASKIKTSGETISNSFETASLGSLRSQERFARMGAQMIALQASMTSLQRGAAQAFGQINVAAQAGAVGLERFITVFGAFPSKTSAVLAIVIAIAEAFVMTSRAIAEIETHTAELNKRIEKNRQHVITEGAKEDTKTQLLPGVQGEIQQRIDAQVAGLEKLNKLQREYNEAVAQENGQRANIERQIKSEQDRIQQLVLVEKERKEQGRTFDAGMIQAAYENVDKLNKELGKLVGKTMDAATGIHNTGNSVKEYVDNIQNLKTALNFAKTLEGVTRTGEALKQMSEIAKIELSSGVVTPLQATDEVLRAMRRDVDETIKAIVDLRKAADLAGSDEELRTILSARANELEYDLSKKVANLDRQETLSKSEKAAGNLASGLSRSIGDAVSNGILQGQKAMEILAGVGQNLFSNFLQKSVDQFEKGMVKAFESIAGSGGEILGTALTGIMGVVGGIFSRKHGGTQSFANIQSGITSSQAVRGIVAGSTSVSIAAVGEDLQRANQPVVTELQEIARILRSIAGKSGGGAAGGIPWPIIPTP